MMRWKKAGLAFALFAVSVSLLNASWIAGKQPGRLVVVAQRGISQTIERGEEGGCTAARIRPAEDNLYIENSLPSLYKAHRLGADALSVDVQRSRDGQVVLFRDATLECRTNGRGRVGERTLAELKALDIGYGYTAGDGAGFPLRGRGVGGMPTVEEALREVPLARFVFNFVNDDPADADALLAALSRAGVKVEGDRYSFHGPAAVIGRLKALAPGLWAYDGTSLDGCMDDYLALGWTGFVPDACRDTTLAIPLFGQWKLWGWPNRLQARMRGAGSRLLMYKDYREGRILGLDQPEQLDRVPRDFRGYVFVEDFHRVGRALQR